MILGGRDSDLLKGSGQTEDTIVDGNGAGQDTLSGYGYHDALLNKEGVDLLEGGNGSDLLLSVTTCDGDTLQGAEGGQGDGEQVNNASWAKLPAASGGVTADLECIDPENHVGTSGSFYSEEAKGPACPPGGTVNTLRNIDDLEGSNQSDAFFGDGVSNGLLGRFGEDFLYGEGADDRIDALDEGGADTVGGGPGTDECLREEGIDTVNGCETVKP